MLPHTSSLKLDSSLEPRLRVTMIIFSLKILTMPKYSVILGIDISKDTIDIYHSQSEQLVRIANTSYSISCFLFKYQSKPVLCVLEPTGPYSQRILTLLKKYKIAVSVVSPSQSDGFAQVLGIISKNDAQAAKTLAKMGQQLELPLYKHPADSMQERRQLLMAQNALKKQQQMLKNQLHAFEHQIVFAPQAVAALEQALEAVEQQIKELEEQLCDLDDPSHRQQLDLMQSVVGIGQKTARAILCATGGLHHFEKAGQLAKFLGIAPTSHTSGSSVRKKSRMSKRGNAQVRACLYMATRSAKKYNHSCKELYQRLRAAGKAHKLAVVAVMNKLVTQIFAVVNSNKPFDNNYYLKFRVI